MISQAAYHVHTQAGAAGHVQLDGYGFAAHDAIEAAELVKHSGETSGDVFVVRAALGDGYGRRGNVRRGFEQRAAELISAIHSLRVILLV